MAPVRDEVADGLEVDVALLHDVGGDVEGDRELGARLLILTVETEVVVAVPEP